jgi:hypothetical protein
VFAAICRIQWKASATAVALLAAAGFLIPLLTVQQAGFSAGDRRGWDLLVMLSAAESVGTLFPILAVILGLTLAVGAWSADHQGEHVYALTLPVARWHYVLLRFGAGLLLVLPVVLAVGLGCAAALASLDLPPGLRGYGGAVTVRFALAAVVSYAATFALAAGTKRTAATVFGVVAAVVAVALILDSFGASAVAIERAVNALFLRPGPFEVLVGPWALIGV